MSHLPLGMNGAGWWREASWPPFGHHLRSPRAVRAALARKARAFVALFAALERDRAAPGYVPADVGGGSGGTRTCSSCSSTSSSRAPRFST